MEKIIIFIFFTLIISKSFGQKSTTVITGIFSQLTDRDSVRFDVYPYGGFPYNIPELRVTYYAKVKSHRFSLTLPLKSDRIYTSIISVPNFLKSSYLNPLFFESGDHIILTGTSEKLMDFMGKGAAKLNVLRHVYNLEYAIDITNAEKTHSVSGLPLIVENSRKIIDKANRYLNSQKTNISVAAFNELRTYISQNLWSVFFPIYYMNGQKDSVRRFLKNTWLPFRNKYYRRPDLSSRYYDFAFAEYLLYDYALKQIIYHNNFDALNYNEDLKEKYNYFKCHYTGLLREKIITYLILSAPQSNDVAYCYEDAIKYITNKDYIIALNNRCQCAPGSVAYNFILSDTNNVTHRLTDFRGKVLVFDFWFTGCGNCRELTPKLRAVEDQFKNNSNVVFISVSSDKSLSLWKNSIKSRFYTTSSDEINLYSNGNGQSDILYQKINFSGAPTLRLIDKKGNWCENPIDCRIDEGKDLIEKINHALNK